MQAFSRFARKLNEDKLAKVIKQLITTVHNNNYLLDLHQVKYYCCFNQCCLPFPALHHHNFPYCHIFFLEKCLHNIFGEGMKCLFREYCRHQRLCRLFAFEASSEQKYKVSSVKKCSVFPLVEPKLWKPSSKY